MKYILKTILHIIYIYPEVRSVGARIEKCYASVEKEEYKEIERSRNVLEDTFL